MKQFFMLCCVAFLFTQCSDDYLDTKESVQVNQLNKKENLSLEERNAYLKEFSEILSKAIYNNSELRSFLKKEALKKFDTTTMFYIS